jgi:hypothetical protein
MALAAARALGEYGSVIFIAGNMPLRTEIAPLLIVTKLEQYDTAGATAIVVVMLADSLPGAVRSVHTAGAALRIELCTDDGHALLVELPPDAEGLPEFDIGARVFATPRHARVFPPPAPPPAPGIRG